VENPVSLLDTVHTEDRGYIIKNFQKVVNDGEGRDIEFRIQLPDKGVKWLCLNAVMNEREPDRSIVTGNIEDVTAIKAKSANLRRLAAKKDSVLEILSHDLAGPLNNIKGLSSLIADKLRQYNDPDLERMIKMITDTSERSIRLIREFVAQEFLESTTVEVIKKRVDIVEKLREVIIQYKDSEEYIAKTFSLINSEERVFIKIDEYKFSQVINNLISNAIKFTHDGGTISLGIEEKEESVLVTVADNGVGIPAKSQDVLFDKFTKARRRGLKGEPSIGLGMSIIKTIVEWHSGEIWFESEENKGTTFYIELPKE
jgi:two-component system sensor histidine kinase VicK